MKHRQHVWKKKAFIFLLSFVLMCAGDMYFLNTHAIGETLSMDECDELIKENPYDYYLLYLRGSKYTDSRQWEAAIQDYLTALAFVDEGRDPPYRIPDFDNNILIALILTGLGEAYTSIEDYESSNDYLHRLENDIEVFQALTVEQQMYVRVDLAYNDWMLGNIQDALIQYHANLLEEDVVKNPSKEKTEYYDTSVSYAQYMIFYLDEPEMDGYLLIHMDLQKIADVLDSGSLQPFFHPVNERERYLQGALYLSTGMYGQATEIFSQILDSDFDAVPGEERNTLRASCLIGLGKAAFMQQEKSSQEIMAYFDQAEPFIDNLRYDMLVDYLYWRGKLLYVKGDTEGYLDYMETIAQHPDIALLKDDVSMSYLEAASKTVNQ